MCTFPPIEYLDYDVAMDIFKEYEVVYLKPLFKGPINEALNYDLKFDSTIPKLMGLPELPKGKNMDSRALLGLSSP